MNAPFRGLVGGETDFLVLSLLLVSNDMGMRYAAVCLLFSINLTKLIFVEEVIKQFILLRA